MCMSELPPRVRLYEKLHMDLHSNADRKLNFNILNVAQMMQSAETHMLKHKSVHLSQLYTHISHYLNRACVRHTGWRSIFFSQSKSLSVVKNVATPIMLFFSSD